MNEKVTWKSPAHSECRRAQEGACVCANQIKLINQLINQSISRLLRFDIFNMILFWSFHSKYCFSKRRKELSFKIIHFIYSAYQPMLWFKADASLNIISRGICLRARFSFAKHTVCLKAVCYIMICIYVLIKKSCYFF